jgi:hypothetical protein
LSHELNDGGNLLARHVELFHHFFDAQIFRVFNDRRDGQPRIAKHPRAADLAGDAST